MAADLLPPLMVVVTFKYWIFFLSFPNVKKLGKGLKEDGRISIGTDFPREPSVNWFQLKDDVPSVPWRVSGVLGNYLKFSFPKKQFFTGMPPGGESTGGGEGRGKITMEDTKLGQKLVSDFHEGDKRLIRLEAHLKWEIRERENRFKRSGEPRT